MKRFEIKWLLLPALLLLAGCAVKPVETELAITHPANPQAESAPFAPPVNVLQSDASLALKPPAKGSPMTHQRHDKSAGKHMNHQKQPMNSESQPSQKPDLEKTEHGHKEHSQ